VLVEYFKWPDRLHYRAEMWRVAADEAGVWARMIDGGRVTRKTGEVMPIGHDSLTRSAGWRAYPFDGSVDQLWAAQPASADVGRR
jgi:hypothetical protein